MIHVSQPAWVPSRFFGLSIPCRLLLGCLHCLPSGCKDGDVKEEQASPLKSENASADALMVKTEPDLAALVAEAEAINVDDFKVKALSCTSRILKLFGGPRQYLDHVFSTEAAQLEFAEFINEKFPPKV